MRDGDDRAVEGSHQVLHVLARLDVEVRFRLVEQQHVGIAQAGTRRARRACAGRRRGRASACRGRRRRGRPPRGARARGPRSPGRRRRSSARCISSWRRSRRVMRSHVRALLGRAAPRPWRAPTRARRGPGALRAASAARRGRRPRAAAAGTRARARGAVVISPASAVSSPARMRSSVDLPPPFGPMIPMRTPGSTSKSSPSRISREPKLFVIPRAWSRDMRPG